METGKILQGRYEILKPVGFGGMADVYLAHDILLDRRVAVKVLKDQFLKDHGQLEQFIREAKSAARLIHPSIINIYDVCEEEDLHYIVMEYVEGITLKAYEEQQGKLTVSQAVTIASQLASALYHAHKHNIVHCDIKPQNILLAENMVPKICDFGISRMVSDETLVYNASVVGSVHYFSPEQAKGEPVTAQSDIYSLGVVLYEMLAGKVPFDGSTALAVARMHIESTPEPIATYVPDAPPMLQHVLDKALAKSLSERYQTAEEMRKDLMAVKSELIGEPVPTTTGDYGAFNAGLSDNVADFKEGDDVTRVMQRVDSDEEENVDETEAAKLERKEKMKKWLTRALYACIVLFVFLGGYFWYSTPNIKVPNVVGLTVVEAQKNLEDAGFKIKLKEEYDANVTPGTVMKQDPVAGTEKKSGALVTITICRGLELLNVPKVEGMKLEDAKKAIEAAGYKVGTISKQWDSKKSKDIVLTQSPKPESKLPKGTPIDLTVNSQEEEKPKTSAMPNLIGQSLDAAQEKLASAGLAPTEIKTIDSDKPANTVLAMTPSSGTEVESGGKIVLTISSGKAPVKAPENAKYVEFVVPGSGEHNVQIFVQDAQKQYVAAQGKFQGGARVRQKITITGPAKVQFFVDQKLTEEKSL
jgi:beta-lactam-binding protein with PASTA domain/tRNA A-37 threonylcarbamoyl transferase component Bud32